MTPERWQRVEELFRGSLERAPEERPAWLGRTCPEDPELVREVERLLTADGEADEVLGRALLAGLELVERGRPGGLVGRRLGAFVVERELGRGGTSTVYLARRADGEFDQRVAIKVLRGEAARGELLRRFAAERHILARLIHPGIARLLDAGATTDGRPYVVVEHVDGDPIDVWVRRHDLSVRERLRLFIQVAEAVAHAHRNLVIHRDLKPSNVLVGRDGRAKLLDFGIAKLLAGDDAGQPTLTLSRRMTLAYASPEQIRGESLTTGTDVFSLGILLHLLLTGRHPFVGDGGREGVARAILEGEPMPPSATASRLRRQLSGDLDAVVAKALVKEPGGRYASVGELVADLGRHLEGRPVAARRTGWLHRAGRFLARHRAAAALVAALAAAAAAAAGSAAVEHRRTVEERDKAERALAFLVDLFEVASPERSRGETITAREILDRGASRIDRELADRPQVQATLLDAVGRVYTRLGLYDRARPLLARALALRRAGGEERELAASLEALADLGQLAGDYAGAERLYRESLTLRQRGAGGERERAATLARLADVLDDAGRWREAIACHRQALGLRRGLFGPASLEVAESLNGLALVLHERGDYAAAEPLYRRALALRRRLLGPDHREVAVSAANLAALLEAIGRFEESEGLFREALAIERRVLGDRHPEVAGSLQNLAMLLVQEKRFPEAETLLRRALAIQEATLGENHPERATNLYHLGLVREHRGDRPAAASLYRRAIGLYRKGLPEGHPYLAFPLLALGRLELAEGAPQAARPSLEEAVALRRRAYPEAHWRRTEAEAALGECLLALGRRDEARALLNGAPRSLAATLGEGDVRVARAATALAAARGGPDRRP